jgi:pilus assembly protein Flp/PilA
VSDVLYAMVVRARSAWTDLRDREEGQTMVEYGLLIGGIALVVIAGILILGPAINDLFDEAASSVSNFPGS